LRPEMEGFIEHVSGFGIDLEPVKIDQIEVYLDELVKWNRRINLTGASDLSELLTMHVLDSLIPTSLVARDGVFMDLGCGNGFPGIPIKIAEPEIYGILVEARRKRTAFIEQVVRRLGMERVEVVWARAEDKGLAEKVRNHGPLTVISRAALSTRQILLLGRELTQEIVRIVLMKGYLSTVDLDEIGQEAKKHQRRIVQRVPYTLPGLDKERNLVIIE